MTVRLDEAGAIRLEGRCPIEDAEVLLGFRLANGGAAVDWTACDHAHAAVVQVLCVDKPTLIGPPRGDFLRDLVAPLLRMAEG